MDEVSGRTEAKPCQSCCRKNANNVAEVYCEDCEEYQCNECAKVHQHFPVMATHKLISVSDAKYVSQRYDMRGVDLCKQHGKILEFFCEDENKLCCSTCAIVNHRKCQKVLEIEEKAKVEGTELSWLKNMLLDIDSKTKTFKKSMSKKRELLVEDEKEIVGKVQDMQDKVHKMFENLKRKMSHDISIFKEQAMNDMNIKLASCDTYFVDVEQYLSDIENVIQQGTPSQQLIMSHYLKDLVRQLQQSTSKDMEEFEDIRMTFEFDGCLNLPPSESVMPGTITVEYRTDSDSQGDVIEKQTKDKKVNLKLLASINLKQDERNVKEPLYSGLDFLPDGRLVTLDNKNKKCLMYNEQLQMLGSFSLYDYPQDVAVVSGEKVAVTTAYAKLIYFLELPDNHEISLKDRRKVTIKYDSVSVIDNEHFAVGTIDDPQPIRIVSVSGEEKELGISFPTKTYPVDHSSCTYIQNFHKVVLTDRYANTVYIYDLASNTKVEVKDEKIIKEPRGVAVGPGDCLFVCSDLTNTVVQISHTGQILSSHVLDIKYPCSVSVSKDNTKLAVSNCARGEQKLQLYSIEIQ